VDHLLLFVWHSVLISLFFAFLWRSEKRERVVFFCKTLAILFLGGVCVAWLMYPFP